MSMVQSKPATTAQPDAATKNIESFYPLSPMQQGMLFHSLFAPESGVYIEQLNTTLRGRLDVPAFERTWQRVVQRHPILRTAFAWEGLKEPIQVVRREVSVPFTHEDWRGLDPAEQQRRLAAFLEAEQSRGFDLTKAPLLRLALLRLADDTYEFVWTHHHILLDGWSIPLLLKEVFAFYGAFSRGQDLQLPTPRPFRDYIVWLKRQDLAQAEAFWRHTLKGFVAPTPLTVEDAPGRGTEAVAYGELEANLPADLTEKLVALARQHRLTLNTLVMGAWALLLSRYSREEDVVFGATVSGRPADLPGADNMIGLFINTLPVRVLASPDAELIPWLRDLQAQHAELRQYEYTPLVDIQGWSEVPRGLPLFESILVFENLPLGTVSSGGGGDDLQIADIRSSSHTNYPITVVAVPDREMLLRISYDNQRFAPATIQRMMGHLRTLLTSFASDPHRKLRQFPLLTPEERRELITRWDATERWYPPGPTIHGMFEAQAAATPDAIALNLPPAECYTEPTATPPAAPAGVTLTYRELNERANQLAHYLRKLGVGPDVLVAMYVDRSIEMVVGILGILKAGGAYVPIDPVYPAERIRHILADSGASILVTQEALAQRASIGTFAHTNVFLDADWPVIAALPTENPTPVTQPEHAAYVIYTSGSTGVPKGCVITHANVVRLFQATEDWYHFNASDVWTLFHSYAFDFTVWELWGALFYGGRLVVVPYAITRSPEAFYRLLCAEGVTVLNQTPSAFRQLIRAEEVVGQCPSLALRYIIFGGEALELQSLRPWYERHGDRKPRLINMYGITETTVHVTYRPLSLADIEAGKGSVIGVPIPDLKVYIVDPELEPVPVGVPGEIVVGGAGVARGYLNRPELTAEKFIRNPFAEEGEQGSKRAEEDSATPDLSVSASLRLPTSASLRPRVSGSRLYRSGDLARYLPDGDIEYLGRIDQQVKIRGFRVEPGEIETVLVQHPGIREAVVIAREDTPGHKRLVAYCVPDRTAPPTLGQLRDFLSTKLPDYMVPAAFVFLDVLPLTAHGKVDRRQLPAPEDTRLEVETPYVAPRNEIEARLAAIWAQVLGVPRVGVRDNFFELGGESILSLQIIARARQAGIEFGPRQLFEHPTIEGLVAVLQGGQAMQVEQGIMAGPIPLTPAQHWFFEHHTLAPHHFNTSMLQAVRGEIDLMRLEQAMNVVVTHHDALRLRFHRTADGWQAEVVESASVSLERFDLSTVPAEKRPAALEAIADRLQASFDLAQAPLVRLAYFDMGTDQPGRLLLIFHHLVTDGVSWRILLEDLATAYAQLSQGQPVRLPASTASLRTWTTRLTAYAQTEAARAELPFWLSLAETQSQPIPLPVDFADGRNTYGSTDELTVALSEAETSALLRAAPAHFRASIHAVLLAAVARSLLHWTGSRRLWVETEGHGREEVLPGVDLSRTVGWFTSIYPVLVDLDDGDDAATHVQQVDAALRRIPARGIGYGILRYLSDDSTIRKALAHLPQPPVNFNYLGQFQGGAADDSGPLLLGPASEQVGSEQHPDEERPAQLYVVGIVTGGALQLRWLYSRNLHRRETIQHLAETTLTELLQIIRAAQNANTQPVIRSDH